MLHSFDEEARGVERKQRGLLQEAEAGWNAARMSMAAIEAEHNPAAAAAAAAREEQERAQLEVAALFESVDHFCRELAGKDARAASSAASAEEAVQALLEDAHRKLVEAQKAASAASQELAAEVRREDASVEAREAALAAARGALLDSSAAVETLLQRVEAAEARGREVEQLAARVAEVESKLETNENPWRHELAVRQAAIEDNQRRLQELRGQLRRADGDVVLWGRVDDLLGKRGLQSFVYEVAVLELQRRAAKYLEILSEDALRLELAIETQVKLAPAMQHPRCRISATRPRPETLTAWLFSGRNPDPRTLKSTV